MKTKVSKILVAIIAVVFTMSNVQAIEKTTKDLTLENSTEQALAVEPWMVNDNMWESFSVDNGFYNTDATLYLESWMTDDFVWGMASFNDVNTETSLVVENWMTDENVWNVQKPIKIETETESPLTLEDWMLNIK